jgi:uncharacterized protein YciI
MPIRALLLIILLSTVAGSLRAQLHTAADSALAQELHADKNGMKQYVLAILREGPNAKKMDTSVTTPLLRGHAENIGRLADAGKLVFAGPFTDESDMEGIFIFNVATVEEAQKLVATDPGVRSGLFAVEMHPWCGPASLQEVIPIHKRVFLRTK